VSPYRIIYNRDPILGMDLITNNYPKINADNQNQDEITAELFSWFEQLAAKQRTISELAMNKKNIKRTTPKFKKDDWILLYEPPVTHTTQKRQWQVPRKFQDVLTGPHRITGNNINKKGEWEVLHTRRDKKEPIHVSRMVMYNPWSDAILDTAQGSLVPGDDIRNPKDLKTHTEMKDTEKVYRNGDDVSLREFVIVANGCDKDNPLPFTVVKITELGTVREADVIDRVRYRKMNGRVFGNSGHNPKGIHRNGWIDKKKRFYFKAKAQHSSHKPLMLDTLFKNGGVSTFNIVLAGFDINKDETLDQDILTKVRENPWVDWEQYKGNKI
jgi:hypothetical protein